MSKKVSDLFPDLAANATSGNWSADISRDVYTYTYKCGHQFEVLGVQMQRAGQVAPPLCPTCHGMATIDKLEAQNWNRDPKWAGYAASFVSNSPGPPIPYATSNHAWLNHEIGRIRQKAWL